MISAAEAKKKFGQRKGIVFLTKGPCSENSAKRLEKTFVKAQVVDRPFQHVTRMSLEEGWTACLFVCAKDTKICQSAQLLHAARRHPVVGMVLRATGSRLDALAGFLQDLEVDSENKVWYKPPHGN